MRRWMVALGAIAAMSATRGARADTTIHSPSELAAGAGLISVGGLAALGGSVMLVAAGIFSGCDAFCAADNKTLVAVGAPLLAVGVVAVGAGVWLALEGGRRVHAAWSLAPWMAPRAGGLAAAVRF